jgi:membrane protease YdiL (CAAX protease family)
MPLFPKAGDEDSSNTLASRGRSPLTFFVLVFALSVPFWVIGAASRRQLFPGLPVSSLMAFCPLMTALILMYRENKTAGVTELLTRAFDDKRISAKVWYAPIVLLMPAVMVLSYGLMRMMGLPLPTLQFPVLVAPVMFLAFFITAQGEELGWSGYIIDPMQERWNALQASILLGLV